MMDITSRAVPLKKCVMNVMNKRIAIAAGDVNVIKRATLMMRTVSSLSYTAS